MQNIDDITFVECEICKARPGHPELCASCLHNRLAITQLKAIAKVYRDESERTRFVAKIKAARNLK